MHVSYEKLWQLCKANKMTRASLAKGAKLTQSTMTLLRQDALVGMEDILRICKVFHCDFGDVVTVIEDVTDEEQE